MHKMPEINHRLVSTAQNALRHHFYSLTIDAPAHVRACCLVASLVIHRPTAVTQSIQPATARGDVDVQRRRPCFHECPRSFSWKIPPPNQHWR